MNNLRNLPLTGPMSYDSHVAPFLGYQKYLGKLIQQWLDLGCGTLDDLPQDILEQATRPVPPPQPSHHAVGHHHSFWGWVGAGAVATLLIGGKIVAGAACGGAAIETGPGAVLAGGACAAAVP